MLQVLCASTDKQFVASNEYLADQGFDAAGMQWIGTAGVQWKAHVKASCANAL